MKDTILHPPSKGKKLYTNLVRDKLIISGGNHPPMTELTPEALRVFDPEYLPGLGSLTEHPTQGIRCPLRGCGKYFQSLAAHLRRSHPKLSPVKLKQLLSLDPGTALCSLRSSAKCSEAAISQALGRHGKITLQTRRKMSISRRSHRTPTESVGYRNQRNACDAQLKDTLIKLCAKLRRTPKMSDVSSRFAQVVTKYHGTWNNGLLMLTGRKGNSPGRGLRYTREEIRTRVRVFIERTGRVPAQKDFQRPALPFSYGTLFRHYGGLSTLRKELDV
jgi:hypothetical protein